MRFKFAVAIAWFAVAALSVTPSANADVQPGCESVPLGIPRDPNAQHLRRTDAAGRKLGALSHGVDTGSLRAHPHELRHLQLHHEWRLLARRAGV